MKQTIKILFKSAFVLVLLVPNIIFAATLTLSPDTGVHTLGSTFSVNVRVNTSGSPINAADGTIKFDPAVLNLVSANRASSIFNLWVTEPTFSNSNGTVNFSGGVPAGYTGNSGTILTLTFRTVGAGTGRVSFTNGSVLANDGRGTNVLTDMRGGSFTVSPQTTAPVPEVVEYVAPANTPSSPVVDSTTHEDSTKWYKENNASLSWTLPGGIVAVRTLLNDKTSSVPTKLYENPISSIELDDLPEGESYFHLQFKNNEGWGKVTSFRLAVDSERPNSFEILVDPESDQASPKPKLLLLTDDTTSGVEKFIVRVDDREEYVIDATGATTTVTLDTLPPGSHTVAIDAVDFAGNQLSSTINLTTDAFAAPAITDINDTYNEGVTPVIKGKTRPNSTVKVELGLVGSVPSVFEYSSNEEGLFSIIPAEPLNRGTYELKVMAVDVDGALSEWSAPFRIVVEPPGYVMIGSMLVNVLSVVVSIVALLFVLVFSLSYLWFYLRRFRSRVAIEAHEAEAILSREFSSLHEELRNQEAELVEINKSKKLKKGEEELVKAIDYALQNSQAKIRKEIEDVTNLTERKNKNN